MRVKMTIRCDAFITIERNIPDEYFYQEDVEYDGDSPYLLTGEGDKRVREIYNSMPIEEFANYAHTLDYDTCELWTVKDMNGDLIADC